MILGTYLTQNETICTEYKEFCFKLNLKKYYDNRSIRRIITQGVFDDFLNNLVLKNIEIYILKYVPRYFSSFHNTKIHEKYFMYFGIDDYNEITGIPFNGNLMTYKKYFETFISNVIHSSISSTCCSSYKITIIENVINKDVINDYNISEILHKFYKEKQTFEQKYKKYKLKKGKWILEMYKYKGKLEDIMNNEESRLEFIQYLEQKQLLISFRHIILINTFEIDVLDIKFNKKNTNSYIYWLLNFKDEKVNQLIQKKPKEPTMPRILNVELNLLTQLKYLRKVFIENNVRYFTFKIDFFSQPSCKKSISYTDSKTMNEKTIKRIYKSCGPACSSL